MLAGDRVWGGSGVVERVTAAVWVHTLRLVWIGMGVLLHYDSRDGT